LRHTDRWVCAHPDFSNTAPADWRGPYRRIFSNRGLSNADALFLRRDRAERDGQLTRAVREKIFETIADAGD
jgi:hypothetical protein